jgi:hypothetical protein
MTLTMMQWLALCCIAIAGGFWLGWSAAKDHYTWKRLDRLIGSAPIVHVHARDADGEQWDLAGGMWWRTPPREDRKWNAWPALTVPPHWPTEPPADAGASR